MKFCCHLALPLLLFMIKMVNLLGLDDLEFQFLLQTSSPFDLAGLRLTHRLARISDTAVVLIVPFREGLQWGRDEDIEKDGVKNIVKEDSFSHHQDVRSLFDQMVWPSRLMVRLTEILAPGSTVAWLPPLPHEIRALQPNDPSYKDQWSFKNTGQCSLATAGNDIDIEGAWRQGYTGAGITVAIVDNGIDSEHPDLQGKVNVDAGMDFIDSSPLSPPKMNHGTRCAGLIAAKANNSICIIGAAHGSMVSSLGLLAKPHTDYDEFLALRHVCESSNHIYSNSWGPTDDGKTASRPGTYASDSIKQCIKNGRYGLGSIYVFASGNGGQFGDDCNFDGFASSEFTIAVGAVDYRGESPDYSEHCSNTLVSAYSSSSVKTNPCSIATTDLDSSCTNEFGGTSAAAPLVSAAIALVLEANPRLSWLDVQYVLLLSASTPVTTLAGWQANAKGLKSHARIGFGILNASSAVEIAKTYQFHPKIQYVESDETSGLSLSPSSTATNVTRIVVQLTVPKTENLDSIEIVQVIVTFKSPHRGYAEWILMSPMGSVFTLAEPRLADLTDEPLNQWVFSSVRFWGEQAHGTWTLTVLDRRDLLSPSSRREDSDEPAELSRVSLRIRGSCDNPFSLCSKSSNLAQVTRILLIACGMAIFIAVSVALLHYRLGRARRTNALADDRHQLLMVAMGSDRDGKPSDEQESHTLQKGTPVSEIAFNSPVFLVSPVADASIRDRIEYSMSNSIRSNVPKLKQALAINTINKGQEGRGLKRIASQPNLPSPQIATPFDPEEWATMPRTTLKKSVSLAVNLHKVSGRFADQKGGKAA